MHGFSEVILSSWNTHKNAKRLIPHWTYFAHKRHIHETKSPTLFFKDEWHASTPGFTVCLRLCDGFFSMCDMPHIQFPVCDYLITVTQPFCSTQPLLRCENYLMVGLLFLDLDSTASKIPLCLAQSRDALLCQQGQIYDRVYYSALWWYLCERWLATTAESLQTNRQVVASAYYWDM